MKLTDIARAIAPEARFNIIGIRPGEKIHEQMISTEDAPYTYEYEDYYKILPMIYDWHLDNARIKDGKKVRNDFCYVSNMNTEWMSVSQLQLWLENNKTTVGLI
jgi:FlaA1/EpsC-like NDP-sugar epimerase